MHKICNMRAGERKKQGATNGIGSRCTCSSGATYLQRLSEPEQISAAAEEAEKSWREREKGAEDAVVGKQDDDVAAAVIAAAAAAIVVVAGFFAALAVRLIRELAVADGPAAEVPADIRSQDVTASTRWSLDMMGGRRGIGCVRGRSGECG
jgi:hypothetical protein